MQSYVQEAQQIDKESDKEVDADRMNKYRNEDEEDSQSQECVSHWLKVVWKTEVTQQDLVKSALGDEFAFVHN